MTRTRADCVADISKFTTGLQQLSGYVQDSIRNRDVPSIVDCMHKFYAGYGAVSAAILSYNNVLTPEEILRYLTTITEIEKEFKQDTEKLANEFK